MLIQLINGPASGVRRAAILDAHAVMGQVIAVTPFSSTVLLITDTSHALLVQVLRNGLRTIAVGTGRIGRTQTALPADHLTSSRATSWSPGARWKVPCPATRWPG